MARYLSADWIASVDVAMKSDGELTKLCEGADLCLQQEVKGGPSGDVVFHVTLTQAGGSISQGPASSPSMILRQTYGTADAIRRGEMNALDAVQTGAIELTGDVARLTSHREALSRLQIAFAAADSVE